MSSTPASLVAELCRLHGNHINIFSCTHKGRPSRAPVLKNVLPSGDRCVLSAAVIATEHTALIFPVQDPVLALTHSLFLSFYTCLYFPHSTQLWYNSLHRLNHRKKTVWHREDFISLTVDSAVNDSDPRRVAFSFNGSSSKESTWIRGNDTRGCALKQTLWMCLMPYTSHLTPHSSHTSWCWGNKAGVLKFSLQQLWWKYGKFLMMIQLRACQMKSCSLEGMNEFTPQVVKAIRISTGLYFVP